MRFFLALCALLLPQARGFGLGSQLMLDTADPAMHRKWLPLGIFKGVTTNPLLLERAGVPCTAEALEDMAESCLAHDGVEVFMAQAWGASADELERTGARLAAIDERIVVKLPLTAAGVTAASALKRDGVPICMTACYARHQVVTASSLGAEYVAPYLGRMSDSGKDGVEECAAMQRVAEGLGDGTRVLVASIRHANQMAELAADGCDTFTFSPAVCEQLFGEALTESASQDFERAAAAMGASTGAAAAPAGSTSPRSMLQMIRGAGGGMGSLGAVGAGAAAAAANAGAPLGSGPSDLPFDETLDEVGGEAWFVADGAAADAAEGGPAETFGVPAGSGGDSLWPEELDAVPEDEL